MKPQPSDEGDGDRRRALDLMGVSRETEGRLQTLVDELVRWQKIKNLVGPETLRHVWTRHIADSAQLLDLMPSANRWLDLGSGGGFPGLVLGILLASRPDGVIHLVESNSRKCAFLRHAARATGAAVVVHEGRIEDHVGAFAGRVDVVTARALAPLPKLLEWCKDLLRSGVIGLFPKGQDVGAELTQASTSWNIEAEIVPSRTDASGRIVIVRSLGGLSP